MKTLTCFAMIWNYEKNSRWNTNPGKICTLSKIRISPNLIIKKKRNIGATINTIYKTFQNISFENSSWGNHFFEKKRQYSQMPSKHIGSLYVIWTPMIWHISQIIVDVFSLIVSTYVFNQSSDNLLLNDALSFTISICLKLKE